MKNLIEEELLTIKLRDKLLIVEDIFLIYPHLIEIFPLSQNRTIFRSLQICRGLYQTVSSLYNLCILYLLQLHYLEHVQRRMVKYY